MLLFQMLAGGHFFAQLALNLRCLSGNWLSSVCWLSVGDWRKAARTTEFLCAEIGSRMQFIVNGFISGSVIALLAIALQCVYLPTRVLFVGLAGIYSLAPFISFTVLQFAGGWLAAIAAAVLLSSAVAALCEATNHAPLARRNVSEGAHFITSLGIYIMMVQAITLVWGSETRTLRIGIEDVTHLGGVVITQTQWIMLGLATVIIVGFAAFLKYSDIGLRLRALADNPIQFALYGYDVRNYRLLVFAVSGALAASSSLLASYDTGFDPYNGLQVVLLALVAVIVGGRGSFAGPVMAALLLGVLRAAVVWNFSPRWQEAFTYVLLAIFLLVRPQGLVGRLSRVEVSS